MKMKGFIRVLAVVMAAMSLAGCGVIGGVMHDVKDYKASAKNRQGITPGLNMMDKDEIPVPGRDVRAGGFFAANGTIMTLEDVVFMAGEADYVFMGESHSSPGDHKVQEALLRAMAEAGFRPVLGLEMVAVDKRNALHGFNTGKLSVDGLKNALDWKENWGFPFSLYSGLFEAAREYDLPVVGLNVPKDAVRAVGKGGTAAMTPAQRGFLPERILPPSLAQMESLNKEFTRHREMMPAKKDKGPRKKVEEPRPDDVSESLMPDSGDPDLDRFVLVQSLWDTKMAEEAIYAKRRHGGPVFIVAGAGHVEYGWGIPLRIKIMSPDASMVAIVPWRGGPVDKNQANVFYYSPEVHASRLGFTMKVSGKDVAVIAVEPDSRAARAGIAKGDRVVRAQDMDVDSLMVLHRAAIKARRAEEPLRLDLVRDGAGVKVEIPLTGAGQGAGTP